MFFCARLSKVKLARARKPATLTELHKAELRARRKKEAAEQSQRHIITSTDSVSSDGEEYATGCYVYKQIDQSLRVSVTVHSTRPPQRSKSLEACRPPPLVIDTAACEKPEIIV
ncbi:hypothetical protein ABL78_1893 [Leptomonas seymouri]|uniref:Uncharacterized protein n=1 Tax=Leptomonas seymouri TaxID=5684 RepID=A0A0N0P7N9_LEPSE|nr:hypothetical protein ABL78_1893 [Leptomonas seymouri]|eukprot:KPI89009.1 hypothetical protein ABL78_1893 [Leptomonas seymouri]